MADGRHAYLLDGENLRRGLDADLSEGERGQAAEMARRYGEVARLLVDTGLIVVSTTNPFGPGLCRSGTGYPHARPPGPGDRHPYEQDARRSPTQHGYSCYQAQRISIRPLDGFLRNSSAVESWLRRLGRSRSFSIRSSRMLKKLRQLRSRAHRKS